MLYKFKIIIIIIIIINNLKCQASKKQFISTLECKVEFNFSARYTL